LVLALANVTTTNLGCFEQFFVVVSQMIYSQNNKM